MPALAGTSSQVLDGLWSGTFDINNQGQYDFTALYIDGRVSAYSVDSNVVYSGTVVGNEKSYQSNMSMYIRDGTRFGTVNLEGTVGNDVTSIVSRYMTTGEDTGSLGLIYDPRFEQPHTLASLEGLWEFATDEITISINLDAEGKLEGADSVGCNYYGNLNKIRPDINALDIELELASCSTADGHYVGMAHVTENVTGSEILHLRITSEYFGMYYPLQKTLSKP